MIDVDSQLTYVALPGLILIAAIVVAAAGFTLRVARWLRGKSTPVTVLSSLASIPQRYLVDVHDVVMREPSSARMHVLAAGGFLGTAILALILFVLGVMSSILAWLLIFSATVTLLGAGLDQRRRTSGVGSRLSSGSYAALPFALAAFAAFHAIAALPATGLIGAIDWSTGPALALLAAGLFGTFFLIPGMALGPMRHAFAGSMHLAFHPRPERFTHAKPAAALQPLELSSERLGVEKPKDFFWNQLLSFDACVQCGRCEAACPAFAAGTPLNPKKLIFDLWAASCGPGSDASYAGHPHPGRDRLVARGAVDVPVVGEVAMVHPDTIWACTTCRACVEECPMLIEHVDAVIDLRRFQTMELGATPGRAPELIENIALTGNNDGKDPARRIDWAADLALPVAATLARRFDVLLWLGEGVFDVRGQRTLRALIKLLRLANVDFAVLGEEEADTGDLARRLGDEATFQALARRNIATLERYRFERILTADPHVLHVLKQEYPALGACYSVVHHTTFLAELLDQGCIESSASQDLNVTYHDPCYLGRYNGEFEAPRRVLTQLGVGLIEMERSGRRSFCCGGGGGAPVTDVPGKRRIPDIRMEHACATGATVVAVACPNCAVMLDGVSGPRPAVMDIAELVAQFAGAVAVHPTDE